MTSGPAPTRIVSITEFVAGSIRETVLSPLFGTKIVPSEATAGHPGAFPTGIVATTPWSSRVTVLLVRFATQIESSVATIDAGPSPPASTAMTPFVAGSIRKIRVPVVEPTQTAPNACVIFAGEPPVRIVRTTRFLRGSIRETLPSRLFVTQTLPAP